MIADGKAPCIKQTEEGATYDPIWKKKDVAKVKQAYFQNFSLLNVFFISVHQEICRKITQLIIGHVRINLSFQPDNGVNTDTTLAYNFISQFIQQFFFS